MPTSTTGCDSPEQNRPATTRSWPEAEASLAALREQAHRALGSVQAFAAFVSRTEFLFVNEQAAAGFIQRYRQAWSEAETVNAVALDAWECDGRPAEWTRQWTATYRAEADATLQALLRVVEEDLRPRDQS